MMARHALRLPRRNRSAGGPDLLPLVNIVFLLLIVFLLAGVVAPRAPQGVDSARADLAGLSIRPGGLGLDRAGRFIGETGALDGAGLARVIASLSPEQPLELTVDRATAAGVLSRALADLQARGISRLRLILEKGRAS